MHSFESDTRIHVICSFTRFLAKTLVSANEPPESRYFLGMDLTLDFSCGGPWVGLSGLPGGSGSRGPVVARLGLRGARRGPFWPVFLSFSHIFRRAVVVHRVGRLGPRDGARVGPFRLA